MSKKRRKIDFSTENKQVNQECPSNKLCPAARNKVLAQQSVIINQRWSTGVLLVYVALGWLFLGIIPTDDSHSHFLSVGFFVFSLLWDACKIIPRNKMLLVTKGLQIVLFAYPMFIAVAGFLGILNLNYQNGQFEYAVINNYVILAGESITVSSVWWSICFGVVARVSEAFGYISAEEISVQKFRNPNYGT